MSRKSGGESSLEVLNKQVAEMKKKIQLLEGQRKAHYEMWDSEKKENSEKIKSLKEEIKRMYADLTNQPNVVSKNVKLCETVSLSHGKDDAIDSLDQKVIANRKKIDLLQHEIVQKNKKIAELSTIKDQNVKCKSLSKWVSPKLSTISTLENEIHKVTINTMEAEHLRKKYRAMKTHLMDESVGYESTLKKLEEKISRQNSEISNLKKTYQEASLIRDSTFEALKKQEAELLKTKQSREVEMEKLKNQVETYKSELEQLERQMCPPKGTDQEFQQSTDHVSELFQQSEYLEKVFSTLKEVTGVVENDDVLQRFLSQKETKIVLDKMKSISESEKTLLYKQKEELLAELETYKFVDVKEQEKTDEDIEALQMEIIEETEKFEKLENDYNILMNQLLIMMERIHQFCIQLKNFDMADVPEKCPPIEKCEWLLHLFKTKMDSALRHSRNQITNKKDYKDKNTSELWSALPFAVESKVSDIDDEEDEIPTRNSLKRESQLVYEARSRRRGGYQSGIGK